jgi:hypothetical protein
MSPEQTLLYKQNLINVVRKQQSTCLGIRKDIKRLQEELTLELSVLEDVQQEIDGLENKVEYSFS